MSLTGTGIQIGSATQFDASINIPRGLATDGTTVWLISIDKAHTLDMDDGTAEAIDDSIVRFGASVEARAATYHDGQVLVSGYAGGVLSVYALDVATGLLVEWLTAALHYDDPAISGTPDIHGIASLNGTLYALDRAQDALFTLVRDGSLVKVGPTAAGFGINALNARSLTVYRGGLIASDATLDKIFSLSHTTGAGTIIGATNLFPEPQPQALLEFNGKLYVAGSFYDALFRLYDVRWDDSIDDLIVYENQSATWVLPEISQDAESFSLQGTPPSWLSVSALNLVATNAPDVSADTNYDVTVRATLDGVNVDKTLRVVVKIPTVPSARRNLTATAQSDGTSVLLEWDDADNGGRTLTDHEVSSDSGATWTRTGSTSRSYLVTGLDKGTEYDFQVRAVNSEGSGAVSATVSETTETTVQNAPTNVVGTPQAGGRSIQFDFDMPSDDGGAAATDIEYRIAQGTSIGSSVAWTSAGTTATPILITGLSRATEYTVEFRVVNSEGAGAVSDTVTVATEAPPAVTITTTPAGPFTGGTTITVNFAWDGVVTRFTTNSFVVFDSLGHYYHVANFTGTGQDYSVTVTLLNREATLSVEVFADTVNEGNLRTVITRSVNLGPPIIAAIDEQFITVKTTDYVLEIPISGDPTRAYADGDMEGFYQNWDATRGVLQIKSVEVTRLLSGGIWTIHAIRGSHHIRSTIIYNVVPAAPIFTDPGAQTIYKGVPFSLDIDVANAPTVVRGESLLTGIKSDPSSRRDGTQGVLTAGTLPADANLTESTFNANYHAENDGGSDDIIVPYTILTAEVTGLTLVVRGNERAVLSWNALVNVTDYEVSSNGGRTWISTGRTATSYTVRNLVNGRTYNFQVRAVFSGVAGPGSSSVASPSVVPGQVTRLRAGAGGGDVYLSWNRTDYTVTRYEYSVNNGAWVSTRSANTFVVVPNLTNGTAYSFRVRAVNAIGRGAASASVSATPIARRVAITADTPGPRGRYHLRVYPLTGQTLAEEKRFNYLSGDMASLGNSRVTLAGSREFPIYDFSGSGGVNTSTVVEKTLDYPAAWHTDGRVENSVAYLGSNKIALVNRRRDDIGIFDISGADGTEMVLDKYFNFPSGWENALSATSLGNNKIAVLDYSRSSRRIGIFDVSGANETDATLDKYLRIASGDMIYVDAITYLGDNKVAVSNADGPTSDADQRLGIFDISGGNATSAVLERMYSLPSNVSDQSGITLL